MAQSIKLKNENYIDSSGITYNRELLSNVLTELKLIILYSNDSGSAGNITLNNSISNYSNIEIIYGTDNHIQSSGKIPVSLLSFLVPLTLIYTTSDATTFIYTSTYQISGTTATFEYADNRYMYTNGVGSYGKASYLKIYKVIAYK